MLYTAKAGHAATARGGRFGIFSGIDGQLECAGVPNKQSNANTFISQERENLHKSLRIIDPKRSWFPIIDDTRQLSLFFYNNCVTDINWLDSLRLIFLQLWKC